MNNSKYTRTACPAKPSEAWEPAEGYELQSNFIQTNIQLKDKNWFETGGSAKFYAEPSSILEFQAALDFAKNNNLEIFVLGKGANTLISDSGFDGLIIHPKLNSISIEDQNDQNVFVKAGAGVDFPEFIDWCLANNILGLEEFSGIPGSVGGSVFINLHYFQFLLSHFLVEAEVIEVATGKISKVDCSWFKFGYNQSELFKREHYLVSATFKLKQATDLEVAYAKGRQVEIIRHRKARYPYKGTCGSFFRNFHEDEVNLVINGKKAIWVAYYLDKVGVKGQLSVGGASVSHQHANMIVNNGNATTSDIIQLARQMQEIVQKEFGIIPKTECLLVGFEEYPLHT